MNLALEVTELRGEQVALQQQLNSSVQGLTGAVQAVQADLGALRNGQNQMLDEMHSLREHGSGLERLARAIENMAAAQEARWKAHEADNKSVSDAVTQHRGAMRAMALVCGLILALVSTIYGLGKLETDRRFDDASEQRRRMESDEDKDIFRVERRLDRLDGQGHGQSQEQGQGQAP